MLYEVRVAGMRVSQMTALGINEIQMTCIWAQLGATCISPGVFGCSGWLVGPDDRKTGIMTRPN